MSGASSMSRVVVVDSTGHHWRSDAHALTEGERARVVDVFSNMAEVDAMHVVIDDVPRYLNPAHVVAWWIEDAS